MAKDVFEKMFASGRTADEIVAAEGLAQIDDEAQIVGADRGRARGAMPARSREYRGGKASAFGFLVGQVMKAAGGQGQSEARQRAAQARARSVI